MTRQHCLNVVVSLALTACFAPADELQLGSTSQAVNSSNKLSQNKLSQNSLSMNKLSQNKLSQNKLSQNQLSLNPEASEGLEATESGREVLAYTARCALHEDDALVTTVDDVFYEFHGLLGLAPEWEDRPLTISEQNAVSACLLAHVNLFGVSVPISVRMGNTLAVSDEEFARFDQYEGSLFGDLFADDNTTYACSGDPAPDFGLSYPEHDTSHGDRLIRRCTDEDPANPGYTMCGFKYVGACSAVCDTITSNGYIDCWDNADRTGTKYPEVMSVWLLDHNDPATVWPTLYDELYGL